MRAALAYGWRVARNLLTLAVVLYVFNHLQGHAEKVIIPTLGLVYVAIRHVAGLNASTFLGLNVKLVEIEERMKLIAVADMEGKAKEFMKTFGVDAPLVDYRSQAESVVSASRRSLESAITKLSVEGVFLAILSLICLWQLFTEI
jgi:hypothetical protein